MKNPGNQCGKKMCIRTAAFARKVAARALKTRGVALTPYVCGTCGSWHLTRTGGDARDVRAQQSAAARPVHPDLAKLHDVHPLIAAGVLPSKEAKLVGDMWRHTQNGTRENSIEAQSPAQLRWLNDIWERHFA